MPPDTALGRAKSKSNVEGGSETPLLIVGGGIGGLAAALALARHGLSSSVLEQRATFSDEGAGIQIGPNGMRILDELGVADALRPLAGVPDAIRVLDGPTARPLAELPLGDAISSRHAAPYWVAHRSDLHAALLSRANTEPLVRVTTGATVLRVAIGAGEVTAETSSGATHRGGALIAADGLWSRIRDSVLDLAPPVFEGRSAARTVLPREAAPQALRHNATYAWLAPGAHVVHYPVRGGRDIAVVVIATERMASRDWSADVDPDWVTVRTADFHTSLRELLAAAKSWRKWSLYALPIPTRMTLGPIALLGDAAHPVLPFLAQGGVMAIEDAAVIAREIAATPEDAAAAFGRYERQRLRRVAQVAAASRRNGQIYHLGGALAVARNAAMTMLGGRRIIESYDWLYGWRDASG